MPACCATAVTVKIAMTARRRKRAMRLVISASSGEQDLVATGNLNGVPLDGVGQVRNGLAVPAASKARQTQGAALTNSAGTIFPAVAGPC